MLRDRLWSLVALMAGSVIFGFSQFASAGLSIVSQQANVDKADQDVVFTLNFSQSPDFKTADSLGRRLDSFQYEIAPNTATPIDQLPFSAVGAVVRGDEIGGGNVIPIRNGFQNGSDPNPAAGGWGTVRGTVPFTLTGNSLSFTTPFSLIGTTNGTFSYRVFTTNYGSTVSTAESVSSVSVPLPSALPAMLMTAGAFVGFGLLRRRVARV